MGTGIEPVVAARGSNRAFKPAPCSIFNCHVQVGREQRSRWSSKRLQKRAHASWLVLGFECQQQACAAVAARTWAMPPLTRRARHRFSSPAQPKDRPSAAMAFCRVPPAPLLSQIKAVRSAVHLGTTDAATCWDDGLAGLLSLLLSQRLVRHDQTDHAGLACAHLA